MADACEHCGGFPTPKKGKPRSVPQHRRFFALVKAAYQNWPEAHDFQPSSDKHLRKWLTAKAGYHTCNAIETDGMTPAQAVASIAAAMKAAGPYSFVKPVGTKLYVFTAESIDFDSLPHLKACALFDGVAEVIEVEIGIILEKILPPIQLRSKPREKLLEARL